MPLLEAVDFVKLDMQSLGPREVARHAFRCARTS